MTYYLYKKQNISHYLLSMHINIHALASRNLRNCFSCQPEESVTQTTTNKMAQNKYNKLANKHVLILGGTSGIGYTVAEGSISSSPILRSHPPLPPESKQLSRLKSLQASYPIPALKSPGTCATSQNPPSSPISRASSSKWDRSTTSSTQQVASSPADHSSLLH